MNKYRLLFFTAVLLLTGLTAGAQQTDSDRSPEKYTVPAWAIKTDLLSWATTTPNLGIEFRLGRRYSLDLSGYYNPWTFPDNKKLKHLLVRPELRYWLCEPFSGHFLGIHTQYAYYNINKINLPLKPWGSYKDSRYEGWATGLGLSYGYHLMLSPRWSMEATLGVGYLYTEYDRYGCKVCAPKLESSSNHYFGPTKAGISLIYMLH